MRLTALAIMTVLLMTAGLSAEKAGGKQPGLAQGAPVTDFGMRRVDLSTGKLGSMVWITDYVGKKAKQKKKLLIINFFANWCKPCLKEMDLLQRLHTEYGEKGLQVVSINFRNAGEKFKPTLKKSVEILKKKGVTYPVLYDRFTNRNQLVYLGSKAVLPALFIVSGDGTIIKKFQGSAADEKTVTDAVKKALQ